MPGLPGFDVADQGEWTERRFSHKAGAENHKSHQYSTLTAENMTVLLYSVHASPKGNPAIGYTGCSYTQQNKTCSQPSKAVPCFVASLSVRGTSLSLADKTSRCQNAAL